jgi:hypothetical protein
VIRHIYLWNVDDPADGEHVARLLNELPSRIDLIRSWSLGPHRGGDMGGVERQYGLVCDFDTLEDMRAYLSHPLHLEVVEQISPLVGDHVVLDLEHV